MNLPVYCLKCKKEIDPSFLHCPACGANQRVAPGADPVAIPPAQTAESVLDDESSLSPRTRLVLEEYARQYIALTWLQFVGIFFLAAYLIGLAMIIYAMVQKPAFRRKVAEMGIDPEAWEGPLRAHATRIMTAGFIGFGCLVAATSALFFVFFRPQ